MSTDTVTVTYKDRNDFVEAFKFFTADSKYTPNVKDKVWGKLIWNLKRINTSPYEFFFFIIYHSGETNPLRICYKNYVTSSKVWKEFKEYKYKQPLRIKGIIDSQRTNLTATLELYGDCLEELLNPHISLSSPVILDTALHLSKEKDINIQPILDKFLADAIFIIYCSPEFLEHCLELKLYMKKKGLI